MSEHAPTPESTPENIGTPQPERFVRYESNSNGEVQFGWEYTADTENPGPTIDFQDEYWSSQKARRALISTEAGDVIYLRDESLYIFNPNKQDEHPVTTHAPAVMPVTLGKRWTMGRGVTTPTAVTEVRALGGRKSGEWTHAEEGGANPFDVVDAKLIAFGMVEALDKTERAKKTKPIGIPEDTSPFPRGVKIHAGDKNEPSADQEDANVGFAARQPRSTERPQKQGRKVVPFEYGIGGQDLEIIIPDHTQSWRYQERGGRLASTNDSPEKRHTNNETPYEESRLGVHISPQPPVKAKGGVVDKEGMPVYENDRGVAAYEPRKVTLLFQLASMSVAQMFEKTPLKKNPDERTKELRQRMRASKPTRKL